MTTKGKIFTTLGVILLLLIAASYYFATGCYSDGERAGRVIKLSNKGMIFKTNEGELIQRNLSMAPSDTWHFSVNSPAIVAKINDAMAKDQQVVLTYCQRYYVFFWQGDTEYFITDCRVVQ
jgi:uncharacterized protein YwgA